MSETNPSQNQNQDPNQNPNPDEGGTKNKVEERINKLYGQKKEAEETVSNLQTENQTLRTQMLELQETVNNLKDNTTTKPNPPAGNTSQTPKDDGNAGNLDADGIRQIVGETVGNILSQREQQAQESAQLKQGQVQSWQQAVKEMPELADQNSDLYKAAQKVWESDKELNKSTRGPYKAAVMARGFIGSDNLSQEQLNSVSQQNSTISNNVNSGNTKKQLQAIEEEIKEVQAEMAKGTPITRTWPKFQQLKQQRAKLLGKANKK